MRPVVLRFVAVAVLFAVWIAYLAYLVWKLPQSPNDLLPILSRPQFLVSDFDVVGTIEDKDGTVKVSEVLYSADPSAGPQVNATIKVTNLARAQTLVKVAKDSEERWEERKPAALENLPLGPCLLPLRRGAAADTYEVVPLPPSPGTRFLSPRIYPATAETLAQYKQIGKR
jgi:hypothetical protein